VDELQLTLKEKEQTISRLREESNRLITDLDKAIARQRELETAMEAKEAELREQIRILEIDNKALRESRDTFQNRNSELMRTVKSLQNQLKNAK
jgi:chromosome segregation ATPase